MFFKYFLYVVEWLDNWRTKYGFFSDKIFLFTKPKILERDYTAENLINSAVESNSDDILRIAEIATRFYPGATWHICDAGYTSSEEDEDDNLKVVPLEIKLISDADIYDFLKARRIGEKRADR